MSFVPNWKKIGLDSKKEAIKYMLAALLKNRKNIIDAGLGSAWTQGKNKHPEIPEYQETIFILGNRMFFLTPKGFTDKSEVK